jgi:D-glycero-alpha-D-manno-heptose-7-phosphate kinase
MNCLTFHRDHTVTVQPLKIAPATVLELEDNLLLFFTGFTRAAGGILEDQVQRTKAGDREMRDNLHFVKDLAHRSREALESGRLIRFGEIMHEHWEHKRRRSAGISNPTIDGWYSLAMRNGAVGGKLVGAGGGGFLLFYARERNQLRRALTEAGLQEVRFRFDFEGTRIVLA